MDPTGVPNDIKFVEIIAINALKRISLGYSADAYSLPTRKSGD